MLVYFFLAIISLVFYFKILKRSVQRISCEPSKYIFITGCDSGFGQATATQLDSLGFSVFATCLTEDGEKILRSRCSEKLDVIRMDVTDSAQVKAAYDHVKKSIASDTGLWSVINNAGVCIPGPLDWQSLDVMKKMADVNLWGLIDVTKTFLPLLKKSNGRLINVASSGGRTSFPYIGMYCSTKFAVEAFTDALRIEMCQWGMKFSLIEPGFFQTNMTSRESLGAHWDKLWSELSDDKKTEYGKEFFDRTKDNALSGLVDRLASPNIHVVRDAIVDAVTSSNPKTRYTLGWDANLIWVWVSRLPTSAGDAAIRYLSNIQVPAQR